MFRIIREDHPRHILVTIEGWLTAESVETAETACNAALQTNVPVTVFLKDIVEIDMDGRAFLMRMSMRKARLRAVGVYSRYIVRKLRSRRDLRDRSV
jgi:RecB family endonuclease NucS